jgi:hypothetical protein
MRFGLRFADVPDFCHRLFEAGLGNRGSLKACPTTEPAEVT